MLPEGTNANKNFNGKTLAVRIVHQKIVGIRDARFYALIISKII